MSDNIKTHIAYRCPDCNTVIYGFVGRFALSAKLLRNKCSCGNSALDISITNDNKIRLSVPCVFCKQNHNFVLSQTMFFERELFSLSCPYANMDIAFIGEKEQIDESVARSDEQMSDLMKSLEAESISDLQPTDLEEDEILPEPAVYDCIRFLIKELEADGKIDCPCHSGSYDLRYCKEGIEVFCPECNAAHIFTAASASAAEDAVLIDSLFLEG